MNSNYRIMMFSIFVWTFLFLNTLQVSAQGSPEQRLFLISNLEKLDSNAPEFDILQSTIDEQSGAFTILVNGDFVDKDGFDGRAEKVETEKLDRLIKLAGGEGKIIFVPGDREWSNSSKKGLKKVKAVEKYLESKLIKGETLIPQKGCLGPEVIDIGEQLRIIAINSQWFVQQSKRPEEEDTDCGILNEREFWDELDDLLSDSDNRNIVLAVHHPPISYGQYAGYKLTKQHFLPPIIGSMIASFRQNIGTNRDLNQKDLRHFSKHLLNLSTKHPGLLIVSGHEYDLQILENEGSYFINSGAFAKVRPVAKGKGTLYRQQKRGFAQLNFFEDGAVEVETYTINKERTEKTQSFSKLLYASPCAAINSKIPFNSLYNPCREKKNITTDKPQDLPLTGTAIAGAEYHAKGFKKLILGKHYRSTWTTPIEAVPYLNVDTTDGGLKPYARGGAAQTTSLKFKSKYGRKYAFRSVNKNPTRTMDQDLAFGVYGRLSKDLTSHQNPYGSIVVARLMDELDLPHSNPRLFLMPDDPALGAFREEFAGLYGFLELKPKGPKKKKKKKGFRGADEVVSTFQMFRNLLDDNDHTLDVKGYVQARIIDMWVSDWDRHHNNWKWLAYEGDKGVHYKPFPKDRDKALAVLNGVYYAKGWTFVEKDKSRFKENYQNLKVLNFKSRTMDRWLANSYTLEDWVAEGEYVKKVMTDEVIAEAIAQMPEEVQGLTRERLMRVLKARRDQLPEMLADYSKMLAKVVDLVGSNSRDLFEVTRLENGAVKVEVFNLKKNGDRGRKLYERTFLHGDTKEIRIYALGKDDHILITGNATKSILIRVIGGDGEDLIKDTSKVKGMRKWTKIYDKRNRDRLVLEQEAKKVKTSNILTFKSQDFFEYNYTYVLPSLSFNQDDGFVFGLAGNSTIQGFNKPDFSKKINYQGSVTTRQNYNLALSMQFRHAVKKWDLTLGGRIISRDRTFRRFYGYGNETVIDEELRALDFYENFTTSYIFNVGLSRSFWEKSSIQTSLLYDHKDVKPKPEDNGLDTSIYDGLTKGTGLGETNLLGHDIALNLDFRDSGNFPTKGMQFQLYNYTFANQNFDWRLGGKLETEIAGFITKGIKLPVTLSLRGGLATSYGKVPFYYKSYLGQQNNHRGFRRNRFGGHTAAYLNSDLRFHFGKVITPIIPFQYGIYGLFDAGRVWQTGEDSDKIHLAYGGGIYFVPYLDNFNLTFSVAKSERETLLFTFGVGFFVR